MQKLKLTIGIIGTAVMIFIMNWSGKPLKTAATPHGIINLEFASNEAKATKVINAWSSSLNSDSTSNLISIAKTNTYWDFLFLFFYGYLLYQLCYLICQKLPIYGKFGKLFGRFAMLAAGLDVIENGFMLGVLNGNYTTNGLAIMVTVSMLKWAIVAVVILYCLIGLLLLAKKKFS